MQVTVARQLYVAKDKADKRSRAERQAAYTKRTVDVARTPGTARSAGSHVLAYADKAGATEENALFGTPDEIAAMLRGLAARPASTMCCSPLPAASISCAVSRARSCRPFPPSRTPRAAE